MVERRHQSGRGSLSQLLEKSLVQPNQEEGPLQNQKSEISQRMSPNQEATQKACKFVVIISIEAL